MAKIDKYLVIQYAPYTFIYSDRVTDKSDFFGFATYETYDQIVIPYPMGIKLIVADKNKTHFNLGKVANLRLSGPMATLSMSWQAMTQSFRSDLEKLLQVSRLKVRLSFDGGSNFVIGEFKTKIKQSNLTGYNETHIKKVQLDFLTQLDQFLLGKVFNDQAVIATEDGNILATDKGQALSI